MNNRPSDASRRDFLRTTAGLAAAGSLSLGHARQAAAQAAQNAQNGATPAQPEAEKPKPKPGDGIRIGLIGAGKFGSMYLAQVPRTPGVHLVAIADLAPAAARANLARVGWEAGRSAARSAEEALREGAAALVGRTIPDLATLRKVMDEHAAAVRASFTRHVGA